MGNDSRKFRHLQTQMIKGSRVVFTIPVMEISPIGGSFFLTPSPGFQGAFGNGEIAKMFFLSPENASMASDTAWVRWWMLMDLFYGFLKMQSHGPADERVPYIKTEGRD